MAAAMTEWSPCFISSAHLAQDDAGVLFGDASSDAVLALIDALDASNNVCTPLGAATALQQHSNDPIHVFLPLLGFL